MRLIRKNHVHSKPPRSNHATGPNTAALPSDTKSLVQREKKRERRRTITKRGIYFTWEHLTDETQEALFRVLADKDYSHSCLSCQERRSLW